MAEFNANVENLDVAKANDYAPSNPMTFEEYTKNRTGSYGDSNYGIFGDIGNFFTGNREKMEKEYNVYLQNLQAQDSARAAKYADDLAYARELKATQDARNWDKMMSDTQYQRAVEDLKKAGLNPWLALQNGVSGAEVPNSGKAAATGHPAKSANYEYSDKKQNGTGMRDVSLLLFALARLAAV